MEGVRHLPVAMAIVEGTVKGLDDKVVRQEEQLDRIEKKLEPKPSTLKSTVLQLALVIVPAGATLLVGYLAFKGAIADIPRVK
jgi:hypothetical protein